MVPSEDTWHVSRVQKRVSKFSNFWVKNLQKPDLFDLTDNFPRSPDNILSLGHCQIPSINCFTYIFALAPCVEALHFLAQSGAHREVRKVDFVPHRQTVNIIVKQARLILMKLCFASQEKRGICS